MEKESGRADEGVVGRDAMIIVDYSTKKSTARKAVQYNYGQVLRIQGGNLQKAQEIQFALEETGGDSLTRIGITQGGVTDVVIPDMILENNDCEVDYPFYVFIYNRDETSGGDGRQVCDKCACKVKTGTYWRQ